MKKKYYDGSTRTDVVLFDLEKIFKIKETIILFYLIRYDWFFRLAH